MVVIKRNGSRVEFDRGKIREAILKAFCETDGEVTQYARTKASEIADYVRRVSEESGEIGVETIQDLVEERLMASNRKDVARNYINYRYLHSMARDQYKDMMDVISEKLSASNVVNQNANVDERSFGGRMGEMSSAVAKKFALEKCMSAKSRDNHLNNEIYIHDLDSYAVGSHNCMTIPFDDLLANGFSTRQTDVRPANSLNTAMQLMAVIFQLQSLQQFGGVSAGHMDWTMVPYVRKSFRKHFADGMKYLRRGDAVGHTNQMSIEDEAYKRYPDVYQYAYEQTEKECHQAVEALYHNLNSVWATQ
ncbi:MAG: hypothetical protein LUD69_04760 [Oscillospiraceae bacterium]|nr:hypothetical protein [Oscillospiraceae bacterium]